jgi:methylglutaconyl-CoA hydratase
MATPYIKNEIKNGIATLSFFHPEHNSLPSSLLNELDDALYNLGNNDQVKVVIIKSDGGTTFCAGASFQELISIENEETGKSVSYTHLRAHETN